VFLKNESSVKSLLITLNRIIIVTTAVTLFVFCLFYLDTLFIYIYTLSY
jgi:hypothetical protein